VIWFEIQYTPRFMTTDLKSRSVIFVITRCRQEEIGTNVCTAGWFVCWLRSCLTSHQAVSRRRTWNDDFGWLESFCAHLRGQFWDSFSAACRVGAQQWVLLILLSFLVLFINPFKMLNISNQSRKPKFLLNRK
jgi:hypothetical protein